MPEFRAIVTDDLCESLAIQWQSYAVDRLNEVLRSQGINDPNPRRVILEEFFFTLATQLDGVAGGIEFEGMQYRPRLVFDDPSTPGLILISNAYDLHDYTHSDIATMLMEEK